MPFKSYHLASLRLLPISSFYAIKCESENVLISNKIEEKAWDSIHELLKSLKADTHNFLFVWQHEQNHFANAREVYAWRDVIESIKASELSEIDSKLTNSLLKSKPIMLRLAGEIANALIHSYNNKHKISFVLVSD
ncbi:MAG: hypothetical protein ACYCQJ_08745 [Nitrososphaerales archaeon]